MENLVYEEDCFVQCFRLAHKSLSTPSLGKFCQNNKIFIKKKKTDLEHRSKKKSEFVLLLIWKTLATTKGTFLYAHEYETGVSDF